MHLIKWFVIINPTSGNGKSLKKWPEIKHLLDGFGFNYEFAFTEYSKHSIKLVHLAIEKGFTNIICVGGDGSIHDILNGIMTQKTIPSKDIHVGIIPIGTGNDWVKTHKIPKSIKGAIQTIKNGRILCQDIGKIVFTEQDLDPVYFNNLAGVGFDGYVANKVHKYKSLSALAYLFGAVIGLFSFKNFSSATTINSKTYSGKTLMVLVGLGTYSGGGMQLTKNPNPFDGLFDVSIAKNLSKLEIIKNLGNLFNGKITNHKKVETIKSNYLEILINQETKPFIQADGEIIGIGNVSMHVIPLAFSFYS
jgi:YegS/Rv2252/BmrU family lipid kinase